MLTAVWLMAFGLSATGQHLDDFKIAPAYDMPTWTPGVEGGIPTVDVKVNAKQAGCVGDGKQNDFPALEKALNSIEPPGAIFLPAGTYLLKGELRLRSGVVLRGDGPGSTFLVFENPKEGSAAIKLYGGCEKKEIPLANGIAPGSRVIMLAADAKIPIGQYLDLRCDNDSKVMYTRSEWDADWARSSIGQVLRVKDVAGRQVTLDRPVRLEYRAELNPRVRLLNMIERAGVEDLSIRRANDTETFIFDLWCAANCWIRNVHSEYCYRAHVWTSRVRGVTVRDCVMHHAWDYGGSGHGYGVVAGTRATDCLIENNTFFRLRHAMMTKEGANGNVFGYNASFLNYAHKGVEDHGRLADISLHGHFSYMNLFEGNVVQSVMVSDYWGPTGPNNMFFRNRVLAKGEYGLRASIEVRDHSHSQNLLGNTLMVGGIGVEPSCRDVQIEKNLFVKSDVAGQDALKDGSCPRGWTLPASLYLSDKPEWWGNALWPSIGADVDAVAMLDGGKVPDIPAEQRYNRIAPAETK